MRETTVDIILRMDENYQTCLMNIMLKYVKDENDRKKLLSYEYELIESLQQQLKNKEADRLSAVEFLTKLEIENSDLTTKLAALQLENKNLANENEDLHKELITNIKTPNVLVDIYKHKEDEINNEIIQLNNKFEDERREFQATIRKITEEKRKLQDEQIGRAHV